MKSEVEWLAQERRIFKALYELSNLDSQNNEPENILPAVARITTELLGCNQSLIQLLPECNIPGYYGVGNNNERKDKFIPSKQISDAVIKTGDPVLIENIVGLESGSAVCLPIKLETRVVGLLHVVRLSHSFMKFEMELLKTISERISDLIYDLNWIAHPSAFSGQIKELRARYHFGELIGDSPEMTAVLNTVADVAETESAVLIEGQSGTGKELLARALHFNSKRRDDPFVAINCAAIPETLLESELFGYEKGAFTGANTRKPGKFELANDGTIFLDEIAELTPLLQVKLLRFLQSHEFEPLGSTGVKKANVRIISATNRDLAKLVESGEFRDDLYYRINVISIRIPSLADRRSDIGTLAYHFLAKYSEKNGKNIRKINKTALEYLKEYDYPGNVRELENIIERAVVLCKGDILTASELPDKIKRIDKEEITPASNARELKAQKLKLWHEVIAPVEKNFVLRMLEQSQGNISTAARLAGMHRKQFQRILRRHELSAKNPDSEPKN
jgi:Nif-specific regulatory protein